jgi:hypothetical protein
VTDRPDRAPVPESPLTETPPPPDVAPAEEPPPTSAQREEEWTEDHTPETRDTRPAVGTPAEPGPWRRAVEGARVAIARPAWGDAAWSFLFKHDTAYAEAEPAPGEVAEANRAGRYAAMPDEVHGPFIKPPVWTWEVPLYFWFGGIAAGSSFVALAADLAGDEHTAVISRRGALATVLPAPPLLIMDLGRPERFLNMLRIFKPRSPMNTGAWCLVAFSTSAAGAVGADLVGRRDASRALGGATAVLGGYLGSYTGVLLAATAVPLWARSRLFLGPIFVATATATGAAACRLACVATGLPAGHPTRLALGVIESGAMGVELALSTANEHRLGIASRPLSEGRGGRWFRAAKGLVLAGFGLQALRFKVGPRAADAASVAYLAAGLCFRYAWVDAGKQSARDDEVVAWMARGQVTVDDRGKPPGRGPRTVSAPRRSISHQPSSRRRRSSRASAWRRRATASGGRARARDGAARRRPRTGAARSARRGRRGRPRRSRRRPSPASRPSSA